MKVIKKLSLLDNLANKDSKSLINEVTKELEEQSEKGLQLIRYGFVNHKYIYDDKIRYKYKVLLGVDLLASFYNNSSDWEYVSRYQDIVIFRKELPSSFKIIEKLFSNDIEEKKWLDELSKDGLNLMSVENNSYKFKEEKNNKSLDYLIVDSKNLKDLDLMDFNLVFESKEKLYFNNKKNISKTNLDLLRFNNKRSKYKIITISVILLIILTLGIKILTMASPEGDSDRRTILIAAGFWIVLLSISLIKEVMIFTKRNKENG